MSTTARSNHAKRRWDDKPRDVCTAACARRWAVLGRSDNRKRAKRESRKAGLGACLSESRPAIEKKPDKSATSERRGLPKWKGQCQTLMQTLVLKRQICGSAWDDCLSQRGGCSRASRRLPPRTLKHTATRVPEGRTARHLPDLRYELHLVHADHDGLIRVLRAALQPPAQGPHVARHLDAFRSITRDRV